MFQDSARNHITIYYQSYDVECHHMIHIYIHMMSLLTSHNNIRNTLKWRFSTQGYPVDDPFLDWDFPMENSEALRCGMFPQARAPKS